MSGWEYKTLKSPDLATDAELNVLGTQGWELISEMVVPSYTAGGGAETCFLLRFKRRLRDDHPFDQDEPWRDATRKTEEAGRGLCRGDQ